MNRITTLDEFILRRQKDFPFATGELTGLLRDIGVAAKIVNREVNKAGLVNILGIEGRENTSGDMVQKLDVFANEVFIDCLANSGECCGIASEEMENFVTMPSVESKNAKYVVCIDPLDGSSNIDVNVSVGTIFSIFRRKSDISEPCELNDFLQAGIEQIAAGYVLYGTSTILLYTTGRGVNAFTLDPSIGEFCLSHRDIQIPKRGQYYSVNQGYYLKFDVEIRRYIDLCADMNLRLRYIGTLVADIHRTLFKGGVFLYPTTRKYTQGKLRLNYECNPMAFIVEQAGGMALTSSMERILEIIPSDLHQRSSIMIGSPEMVEEMKSCIEKYSSSASELLR